MEGEFVRRYVGLMFRSNFASAPSGSYGTMVYIAKAVASVLDCLPTHGDMDCTIS